MGGRGKYQIGNTKRTHAARKKNEEKKTGIIADTRHFLHAKKKQIIPKTNDPTEKKRKKVWLNFSESEPTSQHTFPNGRRNLQLHHYSV